MWRFIINFIFIFILLFLENLSASSKHEFGLEFRTDLEWEKNESEYQTGGVNSTMKFIVQRAHIELKGDIDNDTQYRMRLRWNKDFSKSEDSSEHGLEYWYIRYRWNENLKIQAGKQFVLQGGREGIYNGIDVYGYSRIGKRIQDLYQVGASAFYDLSSHGFLQQIVALQLTNQLDENAQNQSFPSINVAWYGNFNNGLVEPTAQFGVFTHAKEFEFDDQDQKSKDTSDSYNENILSLGARINLENWRIELDILTRNQEEYRKLVNGTIINNPNTNENSLVVFIKQEGNYLQPFGKWIYDTVSKKIWLLMI